MSNKTANASDANTVANNIFNAHEANNFKEVHRLWSEVTRTEDVDLMRKTYSKTRGDIKISDVLVDAVLACPEYHPGYTKGNRITDC
tara:strand:+ start:871 stop:1131 length:261 start_codon:yes stop_codon:yes gene_type:complete